MGKHHKSILDDFLKSLEDAIVDVFGDSSSSSSSSSSSHHKKHCRHNFEEKHFNKREHKKHRHKNNSDCEWH